VVLPSVAPRTELRFLGVLRLLPLAFLLGCGVKIDGDNNRTDDAATQPDAAVDASPDGNAIPVACTANGYAARGTLTSLYRAGAATKTWLDAEAECAADVPGATHLVVLSTTDEVAYIKTTLGWVGLSDRATEGTFVNVTNEPGDLRPFANNQPDNGSGDENCAHMKTTAGLDDDQCNNPHSYLCECDGRAPAP
jgi:Lectin C-type domain